MSSVQIAGREEILRAQDSQDSKAVDGAARGGKARRDDGWASHEGFLFSSRFTARTPLILVSTTVTQDADLCQDPHG